MYRSCGHKTTPRRHCVHTLLIRVDKGKRHVIKLVPICNHTTILHLLRNTSQRSSRQTKKGTRRRLLEHWLPSEERRTQHPCASSWRENRINTKTNMYRACRRRQHTSRISARDFWGNKQSGRIYNKAGGGNTPVFFFFFFQRNLAWATDSRFLLRGSVSYLSSHEACHNRRTPGGLHPDTSGRIP